MRIALEGHGPLQNYPRAKVPWEDVFVRYRPPRRRKYLGEEMRKGRWAPTLIGRLELEAELQLARDAAKGDKWGGTAQVEIAEVRAVRSQLRRYSIIPLRDNVYCREKLIGRRLAETMITAFLDYNLNPQELQRLKPYEFVWKRCSSVITPTTLNVRKMKRARDR